MLDIILPVLLWYVSAFFLFKMANRSLVRYKKKYGSYCLHYSISLSGVHATVGYF